MFKGEGKLDVSQAEFEVCCFLCYLNLLTPPTSTLLDSCGLNEKMPCHGGISYIHKVLLLELFSFSSTTKNHGEVLQQTHAECLKLFRGDLP